MIELGNILRAAGLTVSEWPGWRTRGHPGSFAPVGGLWHHTASHNDLQLVAETGRPDLAAPLANLYLARDGVWHVITAGLAWHAGPGSQRVLDELRAGIAPDGDATTRRLVDDCQLGNHVLLGVEVENLGTPDDPYPGEQINALIHGSAAICKALGWSANHWVHHREWTNRKVDMSYRGDLRGAVHQILEPAGATTPATPALPVQEDDMPKVIIDAAGRPKAELGTRSEGSALQPAGRLARIFSDAEWQAFYRVYSQGKVPGGAGNLVIETRPVAEYDALTGYIKKG